MHIGAQIRLIRAVLALCLLAACVDGAEMPARFLGAYTWHEENPNFGGFSAMHLSADGTELVVISDRGMILRGQIRRHADAISGVQIQTFAPIRMDRPARMAAMRDTEGLAIAPDGTPYVSLEGEPRVLRLSPDGPATRLPDHPAFANLKANAALEVLAMDAAGRLYTMAERSDGWRQPFAVWRFDGDAWTTALKITRTPGYLPVGGDFGPDGKFHLLERGFNGIGFRSRVRRFDVQTGGTQAGEVLFSSPVLRHDNLEGISVWRDALGRTRLSMISDDNFRLLQRTEIVEYVLDAPLQ